MSAHKEKGEETEYLGTGKNDICHHNVVKDHHVSNGLSMTEVPQDSWTNELWNDNGTCFIHCLLNCNFKPHDKANKFWELNCGSN